MCVSTSLGCRKPGGFPGPNLDLSRHRGPCNQLITSSSKGARHYSQICATAARLAASRSSRCRITACRGAAPHAVANVAIPGMTSLTPSVDGVCLEALGTDQHDHRLVVEAQNGTARTAVSDLAKTGERGRTAWADVLRESSQIYDGPKAFLVGHGDSRVNPGGQRRPAERRRCPAVHAG